MQKFQYRCEIALKIIDFSGKFAIIYKDALNTPLATRLRLEGVLI